METLRTTPRIRETKIQDASARQGSERRNEKTDLGSCENQKITGRTTDDFTRRMEFKPNTENRNYKRLNEIGNYDI